MTFFLKILHSSFFFLNFSSYLCNRKSPDGGIGRRAGLKHQWGNPSRFEPGSGYAVGAFGRKLRFLFNLHSLHPLLYI